MRFIRDSDRSHEIVQLKLNSGVSPAYCESIAAGTQRVYPEHRGACPDWNPLNLRPFARGGVQPHQAQKPRIPQACDRGIGDSEDVRRIRRQRLRDEEEPALANSVLE